MTGRRPITRRRRVRTTATLVTGVTIIAACSDDAGNPEITQTLPPIATTGPPTTAAPATNVVQPYELREGDTLSGIAAAQSVPVAALLEANPDIASADDIHAGQIIQIPAPPTATSQPVNE